MTPTIAFITMEKTENRRPNSVGSSRIRGRWLWEKWPQAEEYQVGRKYDVMIFQKSYWEEMLEKFEGIKIFDLCDPDWLDPRPVVEAGMLCDAIVTSTEPLAAYLRKFLPDKKILCIPDRLNLEEHKPRGEHVGKARKVVWFGYSQNSGYVDKCLQDLIDRDLELVVISNAPYNVPFGMDKVHMTYIPYEYESVNDHIKECDMALLPVTPNDLRGQFKSNNKTLTAWALGLPVARVPDDLDRFMTAEARNTEQKLRLAEVAEKWDVKHSITEYQALIEELTQKRQK